MCSRKNDTKIRWHDCQKRGGEMLPKRKSMTIENCLGTKQLWQTKIKLIMRVIYWRINKVDYKGTSLLNIGGLIKLTMRDQVC